MSLSTRRRRGEPAVSDAPLAPIQFRLEAREERVTTDEGRELSGRGYVICDPHTGTPLGEDDFFFRIGGGMVCDLVGTDGHLDDLQSPGFRPGRTLALVRRGGEDTDADGIPVIDVRDLSGHDGGSLPADIAEAVSFHGEDSYDAAFCLWEWRTESGQRFALRLLLAPGWTTEQLPD